MSAYPADPRPASLVKAHVGKASGVAAAALAIMVAFTASHEGEVRHTYVDRLGKGSPLSYCYGETSGAISGKTYTHQECLDALRVSTTAHAEQVQACLPNGLPDATAAAFYDLGYNIGSAGFCRSSVSRRALSGDLPGACDAIGKYVFSAGKDCRDKASGCSGIVTRRRDEMALCKSGLTAAVPEIVPQAAPQPKPEPRSWTSSLISWLQRLLHLSGR